MSDRGGSVKYIYIYKHTHTHTPPPYLHRNYLESISIYSPCQYHQTPQYDEEQDHFHMYCMILHGAIRTLNVY